MPALPPRLSVEDGVYLERLHELRDANENVERKNADGITPERAIAWLRAVSNVEGAEAALEKAPRAVALDREASPGECPDQGGRCHDGATRLDPWPPAPGAR